jgi:hypothetical protein
MATIHGGWFAVMGGLSALGMALGSHQARAESSSAGMQLSEADRVAIFKAAGYTRKGSEWRACDTGDSGASYTPGEIETVRDLNGDGRPEVVVTEGSTYCYGNTGVAFQLLSRQANGSWRVMTGDTGIPEFLKTRGAGGWPDISVGGPGFCFPVQRWNGKAYKLNRFEYEGKRCKPPR